MAATEPAVLKAALNERVSSLLDSVETFDEIDSTNTYLAAAPPPAAGRGRIAWAEHQTAGRGRRDNRWHSEPGKSLCLSIAWQFATPPDGLPALTLAQGAAIVHALTRIGARGLGIKWPNDILAGDAKLGGILTEAQVRGAKGTTVVTGIGLNLAPVAVDLSAGGWSGAISSLEAATEGGPERLHVAVAVIEAIIDSFENFAEFGLDAFRERYDRYDALAGRDVEIDTGDGIRSGRVTGIDREGALLLEVDGEETRVVSGSIRRIGAAVAVRSAGA